MPEKMLILCDNRAMLIPNQVIWLICQMGKALFKVMKKDNPSVGLVNIGEEER